MSTQVLGAFLALAGVAAYVQTVTGFAFGLVMMGFIALFGLLPLPDAAVVVGILSLVNTTQMVLHGGWRHVARHALRLVLLASLPTLVVGYVVLEWLADSRADALVIFTEWQEYRVLNLDKVPQQLADRVVFDGRNLFEPEHMAAAGLTYYGIGRGQVQPACPN